MGTKDSLREAATLLLYRVGAGGVNHGWTAPWRSRLSYGVSSLQSPRSPKRLPSYACRERTIIEEVSSGMRAKDRLPAIHPGEILREEFLAPLGMTGHELALALRVPATRINEIVNEKRGITADTAMRLSRYFGTTAKFWLNMQVSYELEVAEDRLGEAVVREVLPRRAA